jgi:hypothetical protein
MVELMSSWFRKKWRDRRARAKRGGGWALLMGDAPFACLLMSHSLMGHHDQRQESSKKLLKPINDSLPFIVIKVKKVQRNLQQPRLDRVGKWSFFLDRRHRDLLFRYHLRWNWILFIFRWKIGHKGSTFGHTSDMKPVELDTFCFSLKNWTQYFNKRTHFRYETDGSVSIRYGYQYEIQFFRYEVRYQVISDLISVFLICSDSQQSLFVTVIPTP